MHILLVYVLLNEELLWAKLKVVDVPQLNVELVRQAGLIDHGNLKMIFQIPFQTVKRLISTGKITRARLPRTL